VAARALVGDGLVNLAERRLDVMSVPTTTTSPDAMRSTGVAAAS
jgi:hypothetical protein